MVAASGATGTPAIRRIGLLTGGGDAPGLNAVIRAVVLAAAREGWEVTGIRDGFDGLLAPDRLGGGVCALTPDDVHGIAHLGGTILGSSVHADPFHYPQPQPDGSIAACDRSSDVLAQCARLGLDALVAVGGDGTMAIADGLARQGLRVVGVPKTIDNDLDHTVATFGFDTAVAFATECIDRLHSTAQSHRRIMVVETMGRYAGWIALHAGLAGGAHAILIPEIPFDLDPVARVIAQRDRAGRQHSIVVVAEGACPIDGTRALQAAGAAG
ncbi:ATP-dependent 6-phosphofructokinase, partial [Massilia arenosa]